MSKSLKTPCIGVCSTVFGDVVCRGCKRFQHEVIQWNSYSDPEKESVLTRLETLKTQIMESKVLISNEETLKEQLESLKIVFNENTNPIVGYLIYLDKQVSLLPIHLNLVLKLLRKKPITS